MSEQNPKWAAIQRDIYMAIRGEIADAFRALAASATTNACTMVTTADLEHVANIVEGKIKALDSSPPASKGTP